MHSKNNIFDDIYTRLLGLGIQSQVELAKLLGITSTSVWTAKKNNRFPKKWISIIAKKYNVTPEWLLGTAPTVVIDPEKIELLKKINDLYEKYSTLQDKYVAQQEKYMELWEQMSQLKSEGALLQTKKSRA